METARCTATEPVRLSGCHPAIRTTQSCSMYLRKENTVGASRENISKNSPEEKKYTCIF